MILVPLTVLCKIAVHINNDSRLRPLMFTFCMYSLNLCFAQTSTASATQDKI